MGGAKSSDLALGDFLRSRRAGVSPETLSLPSYGRRRVTGIRREELALVAGVSTSYYTRIEQGTVRASPSVLDAIADALQFDDDDRAYMHRLAHSRDFGARTSGPETLPEGIELFLRSYDATPVGVLGRGMDVLGWNRLGHAIFASHLPFESPWSGSESVNWARLVFLDPTCRELFVDWERTAIDLAGRLRESEAGNPGDLSIAAVVAELLGASPDFARIWQQHPVRKQTSRLVRLNHPTLGELELTDTVLRPTEADDQLVILFQPEPGSESEAKLRQLRHSTRE